MSRFARLLPFALTLIAAPAFADHRGDRRDNGHHEHGERRQVPELSSNGAAAGLALIAGAGAIVLGRRRSRRA